MHLGFIENYHPLPSLSWSTWTSWSPSIIIHFHDDHDHHHHDHHNDHHHEKPVDKKSGPFWSRLPVILGVEASRHDWLLPFWSDYLDLVILDYPWSLIIFWPDYLDFVILEPWLWHFYLWFSHWPLIILFLLSFYSRSYCQGSDHPKSGNLWSDLSWQDQIWNRKTVWLTQLW